MAASLTPVQWGFMHREHGDVFSDLPPVMTTSFFVVLRKHTCDAKVWDEYCKSIEPVEWVRRENDGEERQRRASREREVTSAGNSEATTYRAAGNSKTSTG